ncbi:alpha/beta fold hydrolase [Blattabacterium cuenoti]|uniref:alpha/beta fold hydrolase n=1 Tax=Blattabacterium cuenoti TaxID=1653831 RepID=UPI00163BEFC6|nr:alpha/beta fold hydrolase [Blattabacterium cuenoti]
MILHSKILGNGFPLLVFHGLFGNGENWMSFAKEFYKYCQVHLLDIRNHGKSFSSKEMDYELISKDILEYINHHDLSHPILIGHSMGGRAVMKFSMKYPLIPKKIIIVDITHKAYSPEIGHKNKNIIQILKNVNFDIIQTRKDLDIFLKPLIHNKEKRIFFSKCTYRKKNGKLAFRFSLFEIEKNYDSLIHEEIKQNGVYNGPALFLRGENSNFILSQDYISIKKLFPNSKIVTIKKAKHWIHVENPIDFYKEVSNFLSIF